MRLLFSRKRLGTQCLLRLPRTLLDEADETIAMRLRALQHARRWQQIGLLQTHLPHGNSLCISVPTSAQGVHAFCHRLHAGQNSLRPNRQRHLPPAITQLQPRLTATTGHQTLIAPQRSNLFGRIRRAGHQQGMQQKDVQKTNRRFINALIDEGIQVHQTHFHVFHAALTQGMQWALAPSRQPFGANGAIKLVFNLQQRGGQLVVVSPQVADANGLVGRVRHGQGLMQRVHITVQTVVTHGQRRLRITLVAQAPHAQRGGVGQIHGPALAQRLQVVIAPLHKAAAHGRRGAKQIQQQKCVPPKIADQPEILLAAQARQRPVVVNPRNGLHAPPITVPQPHAINAFGSPDVGGTIHADRYRFIGWQATGYAGYPQHLAALRGQLLIHNPMNQRQLAQAIFHPRMHARYQFGLRLTEIGRDMRVREGRTQCLGMRC